MSLESGRAYSQEELKQLNMPQSLRREQTAQEPAPTSTVQELTQQATEPPAPMPEVHPTQPEWSELLTMLSALYRTTAAQNRLISKPSIYATREQADTLTRELAAIRTLLEQAGKKKERRCSLRLPRLRLPRLSPALLLIPPILLALWVAWSSLDTLWNAISSILP